MCSSTNRENIPVTLRLNLGTVMPNETHCPWLMTVATAQRQVSVRGHAQFYLCPCMFKNTDHPMCSSTYHHSHRWVHGSFLTEVRVKTFVRRLALRPPFCGWQDRSIRGKPPR